MLRMLNRTELLFSLHCGSALLCTFTSEVRVLCNYYAGYLAILCLASLQLMFLPSTILLVGWFWP